jgi:hypothetical protein
MHYHKTIDLLDIPQIFLGPLVHFTLINMTEFVSAMPQTDHVLGRHAQYPSLCWTYTKIVWMLRDE